MSLAYYGVATVSATTRSNTSLTVPASAPTGAISIISLYIESDTPPLAPPGYQEIRSINHSARTMFHRVYWKRLGASEGGTSHQFTHGSTWTDATMIVWSDPSVTVEPVAGTGNQGTAGSTATALSVTPAGNNAGITYLVTSWDGWISAAPTGSTPTFTERDDSNQNSYVATGILATAGATGDKSNTNTDGNDDWTAVMVVVEDIATVLSAAYPLVASIRQTLFSSDATAHLVNMPPTVDAGDLLICIFSNDSSATVTTPSGWTKLSADPSVSNPWVNTYVKVASGSEGGTTVDFVTSASEQASAHVYRIAAGTWFGTIANGVEVSTTGWTSAGTNPDPGSLTASWGAANNLFITFVTESASSQWPTAAPSGYDHIVQTGAGGGTASAGLTSARKYSTSGTDNPGAWTTVGAITNWRHGTIVVRPAPPPTGSGSPALKPVTASGTGGQTFDGSGAVSIQRATAAGTGSGGGASGTGAVTLRGLVAAGSGKQSLSGSGAATLRRVTASGSGKQRLLGTGAPRLQAVAAAGAGTQLMTGVGAVTLQEAVAAGLGAQVLEGAGAVVLRALTAAGAGSKRYAGAGAVTLRALLAAGAGAQEMAGSGAVTLQAVESAGTGTGNSSAAGVGAVTIGVFIASGSGLMVPSGVGAAGLQPVRASGQGSQRFTGAGAVALQALVATGVASQLFTGTGAVTLRPLRAAGSAWLAPLGVGAVVLQVVRAAGVGRVPEPADAYFEARWIVPVFDALWWTPGFAARWWTPQFEAKWPEPEFVARWIAARRIRGMGE